MQLYTGAIDHHACWPDRRRGKIASVATLPQTSSPPNKRLTLSLSSFCDPQDWIAGTYFDHFAYGSNMSSARLQARCPSATPIVTGYVVGRQLRFHKVGRDGTAKANAFWTGNPRDLLYGIIYRCLLTDRSVLDSCESLGVGYEEVPAEVIVEGESKPRQVFLYQAYATRIQEGLPTASWYAAHVLDGAAEHRLPTGYQNELLQTITRHESC